MVIGGFTGNGDVIAYDPASPDNADVRHVYNREQFEKRVDPGLRRDRLRRPPGQATRLPSLTANNS